MGFDVAGLFKARALLRIQRRSIMNSVKQYSFMAVIFFFSIFICSSSVFAYGDDETARNTLRGIGTLGIVIDWDGLGIEEKKLITHKEAIKKDVVEMLTQNGIKIHSESGIDKPPFLHIKIHSSKCGTKTHAVYFVIQAFQKVYLKEDQSISSTSPTWSSGGLVGIVVEDAFQDIVIKLVDEFLSAHLSANPKEKSSESEQKQKIL